MECTETPCYSAWNSSTESSVRTGLVQNRNEIPRLVCRGRELDLIGQAICERIDPRARRLREFEHFAAQANRIKFSARKL